MHIDKSSFSLLSGVGPNSIEFKNLGQTFRSKFGHYCSIEPQTVGKYCAKIQVIIILNLTPDPVSRLEKPLSAPAALIRLMSNCCCGRCRRCGLIFCFCGSETCHLKISPDAADADDAAAKKEAAASEPTLVSSFTMFIAEISEKYGKYIQQPSLPSRFSID